MADAVPRTPEEDRPRLTAEAIQHWRHEAEAAKAIDAEMMLVPCDVFADAIILAQRTVAAEAERGTRASIARFQELSLIDQERAEQAERTLAGLKAFCESNLQSMAERGRMQAMADVLAELRRLLQEG